MTEPALDLNDLTAMSALDRAGMLGHILAFGKQCQEAGEIARAPDLDIDTSRVTNIIVMGMGGSGMSGDVARVLFEDELPIPLFVNRHYHLPAFTGPGTLAIAVSYSGNTEETVSGLKEALAVGAQAVIVSGGGMISRIATDKGLSLVPVPAGLQPRAAIGYLSIPVAIVLERLGLVGDQRPALAETIEIAGRDAGRYGPAVPTADNPAKQLANRLFGKMAVVYGSDGITGLAAYRWRCQLNENSKSPGKWNVLPELDHNEIVGWQELKEISRHFHLVFLRDEGEHPQVKKRVGVTRDLIRDQFGGDDEFWSSGQSKLARLFSLIQLGDFVTVYLALLNGIDPSPVESIETLKKRLVS